MKLFFIAALAATLCQAALADDSPAPLQAGAGSEVVGANCNVCHTSDYIVMNSVFLTAAQWTAEVTKMRTAFGAPIDDATAAEITAYLSAHYAIKP
jgi:sulfite dehydrogenase (cytochrome) subunit B